MRKSVRHGMRKTPYHVGSIQVMIVSIEKDRTYRALKTRNLFVLAGIKGHCTRFAANYPIGKNLFYKIYLSIDTFLPSKRKITTKCFYLPAIMFKCFIEMKVAIFHTNKVM